MKSAKILLALIATAGLFWLIPSGQAGEHALSDDNEQLKLYSVEKGDYLLSSPVQKNRRGMEAAINPGTVPNSS